MDKERLDVNRKLYAAEAGLNAHLVAFGSTLAEREGIKGADGLEAVHIYLIRRYGWLPRDVTTMSLNDLRLALHVEMQGWTLPATLR